MSKHIKIIRTKDVVVVVVVPGFGNDIIHDRTFVPLGLKYPLVPSENAKRV